MERRPWVVLVGLGCALALANAVKPLTVDDPVYYRYAAQIVRAPLDPYGFRLLGCKPAGQTLAPPLLLYWWAGLLRGVGERPWLWKLALLPFNLLLVVSLYTLARRFARGLALPLVVMTVCAPAFLPSWNLMLDLPALALGLGALALYLRAEERSSAGLAAVAGMVAGLAMQTKYTGFVPPAAMLLHGVLARRVRYAVLAAVLAALVFASWEGYLVHRYGESHFLYHLGQQQRGLLRKARLVLPLLVTLGGVAPCGTLLGLAALGASRRAFWAGCLTVGLGYVLVALVPASGQVLVSSEGEGGSTLTLVGLVFGAGGAVVCATTTAAGWRLCRHAVRQGDGGVAVEWFLVLWLGLEVLGYFALSPFPAVRRVLGLVVVGTLLVGRLAERTCRSPGRAGLVRAAVAGSVVLGVGFYGVDLWEAWAQKAAAERAARWVRGLSAQTGGTVWCAGVFGFPYYAERAGLRYLEPGAIVRPGDWVVSDGTYNREVEATVGSRSRVGQLILTDRLPLRTLACYYGSGTPLEHLEGPRVVVSIYRREESPGPSEPSGRLVHLADARDGESRGENHAQLHLHHLRDPVRGSGGAPRGLPDLPGPSTVRPADGAAVDHAGAVAADAQEHPADARGRPDQPAHGAALRHRPAGVLPAQPGRQRALGLPAAGG